jgi:hypothetical protein
VPISCGADGPGLEIRGTAMRDSSPSLSTASGIPSSTPVNEDGTILDILVQHRKDKTAPKKFFRNEMTYRFQTWGETTGITIAV